MCKVFSTFFKTIMSNFTYTFKHPRLKIILLYFLFCDDSFTHNCSKLFQSLSLYIMCMQCNLVYTLFQLFFLSQQPSKIGGCLDPNVQLVYIIEFNNSIFKNNKTIDTSYSLDDVPQSTALEITITPKIPVLGLSGPPTSTNITIGKLVLQYNLTLYTCSITLKDIYIYIYIYIYISDSKIHIDA